MKGEMEVIGRRDGDLGTTGRGRARHRRQRTAVHKEENVRTRNERNWVMGQIDGDTYWVDGAGASVFDHLFF